MYGCGYDVPEPLPIPERLWKKRWGSLRNRTGGTDREDPLGCVEPGGCGASIVLPIFDGLCRELDNMKRVLGASGDRDALDAIRGAVKGHLANIADMIEEGCMRPGRRFRTSAVDPAEPAADEDPMRIGIFPVAANPLHWMHLLCGLSAMPILRLDKVVYVVAGRDERKPDLLPAPMRHEMAREILDRFSPLFEYSPISLDNARDGEMAAIELMRLNAENSVHAFYLAGTDHCRRVHPDTGRADTIGKLEILLAHGRRAGSVPVPRISVAFGEREGQTPEVPSTPLDLHFIPKGPLSVSSTAIREAMAGSGDPRVLVALPYGVFRFLKARGLYVCRNTAAEPESTPPLFPEAILPA